MRSLVLLITGIMCRSPQQQVAVAPPCTMTGDADLFEFLQTRDCIIPASADSHAQPDVRLVRGGTQYYDSVSFRVLFENRGAAPVPLDLVVRDQRLCFELGGGGFPSHACTLLPTAPAGVESRARVIMQPAVTARVDGLVFIKHSFSERYEPNGAIAAIDVPLRRGQHAIVVDVPLPSPIELHDTVTIP